MNGTTVRSEQTLRRDPDGYLNRSIQDLFSLGQRTIVVTGGARGIGLAFAFAIAEAGGNVAILDVADEPHPHFHQLAERHPKQSFKMYKTDVTKYNVLQESINQVVDDFGRIDGLITAAGICPDEPFLQRDPESVARCMNINVLGTYYAAQLVACQMTRQQPTEFNPRGGSIVFVASVAAYVASKGQCTSDYCASKGAVVSLAKALGVELAAQGIRVNSISPGYTMTDMTLDLCDRMPHLAHIMTNEPPMRRMADRTDLKGGIHAGRLM